MLATLLLRAGKVVSASTLIEALWDDEPPVTARNSVQGHVKQLRRLLGPAGERIVTRMPGYLIEVRPGELDLDRFVQLTASARSGAAAGAWEDAIALFNQALELWRGEPLSDIPSSLLQRNETPRLAELRAQALDARIDAELRSGRHDAVTAELRHLVSAHPHRERSWAQLMLALYLGGRQGEAMAVYGEARTILRDDLGIDPGSELRELHHRILTADAALTEGMTGSRPAPAPPAPPAARPPAPAGTPQPAPTQPAPMQLPADLRDFTGRDAEISELIKYLAAEGNQPGAVPVAAIAGQGGIGKTALAVHVAHQVAAGFTGGQLFVSLGGAVSPVKTTDILATFLRDLGVPDAAIPPTEAERAARYRTMLASRKTLVVLDDARSAAQVRPLLPGSGGSAVIVTSRAMLTGIAGAAFVTLDVLGAQAARMLFSSIVGRERTAAEPAGTDGVLESCAGLPLAIRIAGSRLASRPQWSVSRLSGMLADEHRRLSELTSGELAVRTSMEVSYRGLRGGQRIFRLFGLSGFRALSLPALGALAGLPEADAASAVEALIDAHLLEALDGDRFRMHDLVRLYAAERSGERETEASRRAALHGLLAWYAHSLHAAVAALGKLQPPFALDELPEGVRPAAFGDIGAALEWLAAERASLVKAVSLAHEQDMPGLCTQLARLLRGFCEWSGYWTDLVRVSVPALAAARVSGDRQATAGLLNNLGSAYLQLRQTAPALRHLRRSVAIYRELGDTQGAVSVLSNLGVVELRAGLTKSADSRFTESLEANRFLGNLEGQGYNLHNLGYVNELAGDNLEAALDYYQQALEVRSRLDSLHDQAATLHSIGDVLIRLGRTGEGMRYLDAVLAICTGNGMRYGEGMTLASLGDGFLALGQPVLARDTWLRAHAILVSLGAPEAPDVLAKVTALQPSPNGHGALGSA